MECLLVVYISEFLKYRRNGITKLEGLYVFLMLCYTIKCCFLITESAEFDVLAQEHEKLQENKVHVQHICMYIT